MNWYIKVLKNYANFEGRARRKEYWMFYLFNFLAVIIIGFLAGIISGILKTNFGIPVFCIYYLAIILPSLAVAVRRLHDIGKSGWWLFISLIPIVGSIILLVWLCIEGTPGQNQYGPNPKEDAQFVPVAPIMSVPQEVNQNQQQF